MQVFKWFINKKLLNLIKRLKQFSSFLKCTFVKIWNTNYKIIVFLHLLTLTTMSVISFNRGKVLSLCCKTFDKIDFPVKERRFRKWYNAIRIYKWGYGCLSYPEFFLRKQIIVFNQISSFHLQYLHIKQWLRKYIAFFWGHLMSSMT